MRYSCLAGSFLCVTTLRIYLRCLCTQYFVGLLVCHKHQLNCCGFEIPVLYHPLVYLSQGVLAKVLCSMEYFWKSYYRGA